MQSLRKASENKHARISASPFNPTDIRKVDFGGKCQLLLGKPTLLSAFPHICSDDGSPILHAAMDGDPAYIL